MGKTESIKERRVDVYLDTLDRKERWTDLADDADESLSKFVQRCVEYAIEHGGPDPAELGKRSKRVHELEQTVTELKKEIEQKDIVIDRLNADLKRYRMEPFLTEGFEGVRQYDEELIEILQDAGHIRGDELLRRLGVKPTETEIMQGIDRQLEQLERYGLVASTAEGWRWLG